MTNSSGGETDRQIAETIRLVEATLGQDLLGVYLHGSSVVGGLQKYSDLDLFVVSARPTTHAEKARLVAGLLSISSPDHSDARRPIELTIVVQSEVNPWRYPPTFDFQYGDWLREDFESGNVEPWPAKIMPDLAMAITQVLLGSRTLLGPAPDQLLDRVPYRDFMTASTKELDSLMADLAPDTRNVLLTFARMWSTVETDQIRSKPDAAAWVMGRLPEELRPVMRRARAICMGEEDERWDDLEALVRPCAEFMVGRIRQQSVLLASTGDTTRSIRLAGQS